MTKGIEIAANIFNAASILLAARNSFHTWWAGIVGCVLFSFVFLKTQLYADATLQVFFIVTSILGWRNWVSRNAEEELPIRRTQPLPLVGMFFAAVAVATLYGWLLHRFTNAFAPFLDSVVLAFSVLGQLLLMHRRYESWWCWLLVNTVAVPLYFSRELTLTAVLYSAFWVNALIALFRWRKLITA